MPLSDNTEEQVAFFKQLKTIVALLQNHLDDPDIVSQAEAMCQPLLAQAPENTDLQYTMGVIAQTLGRYEEAIGYMNSVVEKLPQDQEMRQRLANLHRFTGGQMQALRQYLLLLSQAPQRFDIRCSAVEILAEMQAHAESVRLYVGMPADLSDEMKPRAQTFYNNLGHALTQLGRIEEAIALHNMALSIDPMDTVTLLQLKALIPQEAQQEQHVLCES